MTYIKRHLSKCVKMLICVYIYVYIYIYIERERYEQAEMDRYIHREIYVFYNSDDNNRFSI